MANFFLAVRFYTFLEISWGKQKVILNYFAYLYEIIHLPHFKDMKSLYLTITLALLSFGMAAQSTVNINPEIKHQTMEFFGAADAWSGNFVGKYWNENRKKEIADYLFSQDFDASGNPVGIGLSIWRVNLGAGTLEQSGADIYPYQRRAESYITLDGSGYDWGKCAGHEYFMQAAKERGCNQFILFSNSPLVQFTENGKGYSSYNNKCNLRQDCYDAYAKYLADVTSHLMDKGYNIPYISPINEPQVDWCRPTQEGSPWRNGDMFKMITALDKALGQSPKFNDTRIFVAEAARFKALYTNSESMLKIFDSDTLECPERQLYTFFDTKSPYYISNLKHVDNEFTAHPYHNHFSSEELREVHRLAKKEIDKYGIDFHSSEWCLLPSEEQYGGITADWGKGNHGDIQAALMMARIIHSDFVDTEAVSWCYWKGMELNGNHALISLYATDGDIHKGGYVAANKMLWALGNYSRFIRPGYTRISLDGADDLDSLAGTAFVSPDGTQIVTVFVNSSFEDIGIDVKLPKTWKKKLLNVKSYRTDARHDLAKSYSGKDYHHTIGARGLTTIVFDFQK